MKDNVLIEGGYRSRKIASFQRRRQDSLCHSREAPRFVGKGHLRCHSVASNRGFLIRATPRLLEHDLPLREARVDHRAYLFSAPRKRSPCASPWDGRLFFGGGAM
jgi:hypothetical protein